MMQFLSTGLLALALVSAGHTGALAQYADYFSSGAAKAKAILPTVIASTNCIAQRSLNHSGIVDAYRAQNIQPILDAVWSQCANELSQLVKERERLYGWGTGEGFVKGAYRDDLPRAVLKRIKDALDRRLAAIEEAERNAKSLAAHLYSCTSKQLRRLVSSGEGAELLAAAAMASCGNEVNAALDAILEALRATSPIEEAEARNRRLEARNTFHRNVVLNAVQELAERRRAERTPRQVPPAESASPPAETSRQSGSSGTGFAVSEQGHILTNAHVVKACAEPKVFTSDAPSPVSGRVLAKDERNDLALIQTTIRPAYVPRFRSAVRLGEPVTVFGYPLTGLLSSSGNFSAGNITALTGMADDSSMLQVSAPVQPGNSGGPLLDETGNVVGVVVSKLDALKIAAIAKDIPQNINFAIRAATATTFLEINNISFKTGDRGPARPSTEIAEQAKRMSVRIQCDGTSLSAPSRASSTVK
jgi:S1-C subfamily serine protease